ncbi:30S ribosomal protein S1 [Porphyromonas asaccharolytica]|uniref:Small ribosomal subunit protein bS1 n=1 Tax=Porphyromonas asaccharolytica (strain ATCC 25260 / DSM 20707 / BCRC 10618 / CCUG 7834 / JCM 6326 / LMG 13178 / VPI 4198 / B440) TaxID=879243 RepID=F4KJS6_PORAD|nr:30S ribosomal protein S1 [Porphyromonas asaccharolytica]AEE12653.1 RNA binding S1 domain protein [Porphyromonas asaccharolytica DSM 20707]
MSNNPTDRIQPLADFDWSGYAQDTDISPEMRKEREAIYDKTLTTIKENEVVMGKVMSISKREVLVNIGYKSAGIISANEFNYNKDLKVGDEVEVLVESKEDRFGQLQLSHRKARAARAWEKIAAAQENDEVILGYIKSRVNGGMIVDIFGIEAFLPGSQIDVRPIKDYDAFVDKTMEFKIVKVNPEYRNVVVSHKVLIEAELEQQKKEIISKLEKGQVLEGVVKGITSYGAFVDLGGVDGLIHITDLSWGRIGDPSEVVSLDEKINVVILDFDEEKTRIALGLKQLMPHPWDALDPNLKEGDIIHGRVVVITDYGAFVEVIPGVEGLIHVSEMSWTQHLRSAQEFLTVGQEVDAVVLMLDREDRKMSLGLKQLKPDPWETIEQRFPVGSNHEARVRNFTNYGVFVELDEGIDGLIHISDLSWTRKVKHPNEFVKVGQMIEVQVLEIDKENRRLSLGHKQVTENPWDEFAKEFTIGSIHEGTVIRMNEKGATIALPYGVEAFATPKHLVKEDGSSVALDEKLPFKILDFNPEMQRIIVSHSRIHEDAERAERRQAATEERNQQVRDAAAVAATQQSVERATLGDLDELAALKERLESAE